MLTPSLRKRKNFRSTHNPQERSRLNGKAKKSVLLYPLTYSATDMLGCAILFPDIFVSSARRAKT
jgi:hypothetical protein